jgi:hypothetical protein
MKIKGIYTILAAALCALMLMLPSIIPAQTEQSQTEQSQTAQNSSELPPIEQQLVREGDFAVKLSAALAMGDANDEAEAENLLAETGITPKNGWLADYPVTPDIAGELRDGVIAAADAGKLFLDKEKALQEFDAILDGLGLPMVPQQAEIVDENPPEPTESYVEPDVVNNYYYSEGPPIVTYYPPPPTYVYLYSWVPYPFWTWGYFFPGFFILNDFHRTVVFHRRTFFISNHFRDLRTHRVFRVHPRTRHGSHVYGVRYRNHARSYSSSGAWASTRDFSDWNRARTPSGNSTLGAPSQNSRVLSQAAERQVSEISSRAAGGTSTNTENQVFRPRPVMPPSTPNRSSFSRGTRGSDRDSGRQFTGNRSFAPATENVRSFTRNSSGFGRDTGQRFSGARSVSSSTRQIFNSSNRAGGSGRSSSHFNRSQNSAQDSRSGRSFSRSSSSGGGFSHGGGGSGRGRR